MKRIVFLLVIGVSSFWAIDWTGHNIEVVSRTNRNDQEVVVLRDVRGFVFGVENVGLLLEAQVPTVLQMKDVVASWRRIVPERLTFVPTETGIEILLLPRVMMYRGQDFVPFFPAGLRFSWRVGLSYDFRMVVGTNLLRLRGAYESEEELLARVSRAVRYPSLYMRSDDIDVLLEKLEGIDERMIVLEAENHALKRLWLAYLNRGFFGQLRPIADAVIDRVVQTKKNNMHWSERDIYQALRGEGVVVSQREVDLILLVYFSQY